MAKCAMCPCIARRLGSRMASLAPLRASARPSDRRVAAVLSLVFWFIEIDARSTCPRIRC